MIEKAMFFWCKIRDNKLGAKPMFDLKIGFSILSDFNAFSYFC